ncbi:hypothetical protein ATCC90586_005974 [Pythium insidiosum]|nr:hypothetical protein ATCC90586_005974 [Pythium insidiosum]
MPMAMADTTLSMERLLPLLRWRQTRRGYDGDDALLATGGALLQPDGRALAAAAEQLNVPAARVVTEVLQLALLLVAKPRHGDRAHARAVLHLLHLSLKALRRCTGRATPSIPLNACNLLLSTMAETLESCADDDDGAQAVADVHQVFVFLFALEPERDGAAPSFAMYRPPTNVYSAFLQRSAVAVVALLDAAADSPARRDALVALLHAVVVVFRELQHSQLNKKKVFLAIAKTSLRDLVTLRRELSRLAASAPGVAAVRDVLDRVLVDALFDSEHLREYEGAMTRLARWRHDGDDAATGSETGGQRHKKPRRARERERERERESSALASYPRHLFDELQALLADATLSRDVRASVGALLRVLVRGFALRIRAAALDKIEDSKAELKTSKKRVASVIATTSTTYSPFKFWAELCAVALDAAPALDVELTNDVMAALFAALGDADVYRVTEDTEDQEQFHMMERILAGALAQCRSARAPAAVANVCAVVSSAVRCTPNLVHSNRRAVLSLLAELAHDAAGDAAVAAATSGAMVELLRAYESMRLVDAWLRACVDCSDDSDAVARGLALVLRHHATEDALRRTFRTLPPGQLEIVWRLCRDRLAVLCGRGPAAAPALALVRALLAVFLQELHITPQNRAKVGELVAETHEQLLAALVGRVQRLDANEEEKEDDDDDEKKKKTKKKKTKTTTPTRETITVVERELFSVFGELLALYDGLAPATRAATLDVVLAALAPALVPVLSRLLADDATAASAGVIKIGVHWLRRERTVDGLAALLLAHVAAWTTWDAVAFYLPDLLADAPADHAHALFRQVLSSLVAGGARADAARRLLLDAAFFEIAALRRVAPRVIQELMAELLEAGAEPTSLATLLQFLLAVPSGYLSDAQALLATALRAHRELSERSGAAPLVLELLAQWIERHLAMAAGEPEADGGELQRWTTTLLLRPTAAPLPRRAQLVDVLVRHHAAALDAPLATLLQRAEPTPHAVQTSCLVLEAAAQAARDAAPPAWAQRVLSWARATPTLLAVVTSSSGAADDAFRLLSALVRYSAALSEQSAERRELLELLAPRLDAALATAMRRLSSAEEPAGDAERAFFLTVCDALPGLRAHVTLETFGCLLAVALSLAGARQSFVEPPEHEALAVAANRPLLARVAHASKPEFRLLLATVRQELLQADDRRVVGALKALVFTLDASDKKLSPSRRQLLGEHKSALVGVLVELLGRSLATTTRRHLCGWALRAFVLCYCKAELFSWQPHELLQVFHGFAPLASAAATAWPLDELHELWLLSYHLLLRVVRHHFASLLHALPLMVDALNALLRVLTTQATRTSPPPRHVLEWSANLARLYGYLKPHDAAVRKHVVYLLVAYLRGVTHDALPLAVQQRLRAGVFALLEICSTFEKEQLYASLDAAGKSLLKSLDTSYKLTYRYAGKV